VRKDVLENEIANECAHSSDDSEEPDVCEKVLLSKSDLFCGKLEKSELERERPGEALVWLDL
jgi:hypothetical protein